MKLLINMLSPDPSLRPSAYRLCKYIWRHYTVDFEERLNYVINSIGTDEKGLITAEILSKFLRNMKKLAGKAGSILKKSPEKEAQRLVDQLGKGNGKKGILPTKFVEFMKKYYREHPTKLALMEKCISKQSVAAAPTFPRLLASSASVPF
eukprot:CAMPEP_0197538710 /NCGR_PEP_ID=MMETSP1318-20131121/60393_1 /TAXON_ID=552666 /ORGANISM="Partenskyella glossopodia, Strain RCC365" /LENGTH=149 /DNA_ID=CAMNT_0043097195 /DNA_START=230 /DNA_END=679 /DNA_ORIENTATION=-